MAYISKVIFDEEFKLGRRDAFKTNSTTVNLDIPEDSTIKEAKLIGTITLTDVGWGLTGSEEFEFKVWANKGVTSKPDILIVLKKPNTYGSQSAPIKVTEGANNFIWRVDKGSHNELGHCTGRIKIILQVVYEGRAPRVSGVETKNILDWIKEHPMEIALLSGAIGSAIIVTKKPEVGKKIIEYTPQVTEKITKTGEKIAPQVKEKVEKGVELVKPKLEKVMKK